MNYHLLIGSLLLAIACVLVFIECRTKADNIRASYNSRRLIPSCDPGFLCNGCGRSTCRSSRHTTIDLPPGCPLWVISGRTSCLVDYLPLPARRDESMPLRCFAFRQGICLNHVSTNETFLKTFKCCRTPIQRHPQRGVLGVHLKLIYRSKP